MKKKLTLNRETIARLTSAVGQQAVNNITIHLTHCHTDCTCPNTQ
ncbi:MAG TPA: class I lanthipeptide [Longimicrobiaceae bacterium]|nr:class I lanthipeptide [Longimicrobiaceae bacterium]